jgi:hypothetical protein
VVLALVALELLAHGALVLARQELAASRAGARLLQARVAAEAAYQDALTVLSAVAPPALPLGGEAAVLSGTLGAHTYRASVTRLSREAWEVAGEGQAHGTAWGVRFGGPVWMMDPAGRLASREAVVEVAGSGTWMLQGVASRFEVPEVPPPDGGACAVYDAILDTLRAVRTLPEVARVIGGPDGEPSLGPLDPASLSATLSPLPWDAGSPHPSEVDGACDVSDPLNLGDPAHPDAPCGDHSVALWREGDATLLGGAGQGLLAVSGNLVLMGARWEGVLLAGGTLTLQGGAHLLGAARADGLFVDPASRVTGSACRVLRALDAARPSLARPIPLWAPVPMGPSRPR